MQKRQKHRKKIANMHELMQINVFFLLFKFYGKLNIIKVSISIDGQIFNFSFAKIEIHKIA